MREASAIGPRAQVRRGARIAGFGVLTAAMLPGFAAHEALAPASQRGRVREAWVGVWCAALLRLFGVRVQMYGRLPERPAGAGVAPSNNGTGGRGRLVVSNHRSTADILVLLRAFGGKMVSRADLARWPLVGAAARSVGTLFVDRADAASGASTVRAIRNELGRGETVIVFPEGTTFVGDEVRPFHAGAFVAAMHTPQARAPEIVPVGLAYAAGSQAAFVNESFGAHLGRVAAAEPSDLAVCVGEPLAIGSGVRASELRDTAHAEVQRLVREARALVDT